MVAILQQSRGDGEIERGGHLERAGIALDDTHLSTDPLNEAGIIGGNASAGMGMLEHLTQEALRGLYAAQRLAIGSCQDMTLVVHHLDGVGHREAWDNGGMACTDGVDHPGEQLRRCQTPGGVMDKDDAVVVVQRREPCRHRGHSVRTPGHDIHTGVLTGAIAGLPIRDVASLLKVRAGRHDDHVSNLGATQNAPQRVSQ
jgi:hypothetical protein